MIRFVSDHLKDDTASLSLRYHGRHLGFDLGNALIQIEARRKCRSKLNWFLSHDAFLFPSLQSAEQASNQAVALFHALLTGNGNSIADLTAGLGIDAMTLALTGNRVTAFEIDHARAETLRYNSTVIGADSLKTVCGDSILALKETAETYDWLFIDPARRDITNNRCFLLQDSLPNVIENEDLLLQHGHNVLVKASPLLDISQTLKDLRHIKTVHIVSYRGEVKELLAHLAPAASSAEATITVTDIADAPDFPDKGVKILHSFTCGYDELQSQAPQYADKSCVQPGMYIYELSGGMRKLQCPGLIGNRFPGLKSMSRDSGLFVSSEYHADFPGRIERITRIADKEALRNLKGKPYRVVSRDYPMAAEKIRSRYKLREGNTNTLYATSVCGDKTIMLLTDSNLFGTAMQ